MSCRLNFLKCVRRGVIYGVLLGSLRVILGVYVVIIYGRIIRVIRKGTSDADAAYKQRDSLGVSEN